MASTLKSSSQPISSRRHVPSVSYETFAPRSTSQVSRLSRIAALTAGPTARAAAVASETNLEARRSHLLMEVMKPPEITKIEDASESQQSVDQILKETATTVDRLKTQVKHTTSLKLALRASINIAEDISNRHADLIRHSGELSAAADRLQEEERMLTRHAEEIGMPLKHYDAVDRIGITVGVLFKGRATVRGLAKIKVDSDEFPDILDQIDQAVSFFGNECGGKEVLQAELKQRKEGQSLTSGNIEYYRRALALQEAALDLIREAVAERIAKTTQQISDALNIANGNTVQADQLEASLIFTRFHGISSRSNRLLGLVKSRVPRSGSLDVAGVGDAYVELLQHCRQTYCKSRESLLLTTVRSHMDKLKDLHGPVGMTRLASVFLIRLCTIETSLYLDFFGEGKGDKEVSDGDVKKSQSVGTQIVKDETTFRDAEFQAYLSSLCSALHRTVRRSLVTMLDLDTLCQIVSVLREERSMASSSPTTLAAARAISSVIQDAQERLIFCANQTLMRDVIKFKATPADLNYPDKLIKKEAASASGEVSTDDDDAMELQLQQVYESWFPPLRTVLRILSKIFRVVEARVFEDMALTSVQACTRCLKEGAEYIKQTRGERHADLFLVKHLLTLREQLSPFDIELRAVERQLDFSEAGKAVARFLANRNRRIFSMSTENALVTLLREGVSVQESSVDSKRDLEDALRSACNDFIENTARSLASELLETAEAYRVLESLSEDKSASADHLLKILGNVEETIQKALDEVISQMKLYLDNPATLIILLKPMSRKVSRALEDIRKITTQIENGTNGWDEENKNKMNESIDSLEQVLKSTMRALK